MNLKYRCNNTTRLTVKDSCDHTSLDIHFVCYCGFVKLQLKADLNSLDATDPVKQREGSLVAHLFIMSFIFFPSFTLKKRHFMSNKERCTEFFPSEKCPVKSSRDHLNVAVKSRTEESNFFFLL